MGDLGPPGILPQHLTTNIMKTHEDLTIKSIKDTQYGQRLTFDNGLSAFNYKALPVELGYICTMDHYDKGEEQDWMQNDIPEDGRNYLQSANPIGRSYVNNLESQLLKLKIKQVEAQLA